MNNLLKTVVNRLERRAPFIIFSSLAIFAGMFYYRFVVLTLAQIIYPELGIPAHILFLLSAAPDAEAALACSLIAAMVILIAPGRSLRTAAWIFPAIVLTSLWVAIEFFRIYETTFQPSFMDRENLTGMNELIRSMAAEASSAFIVRFVLTLTLLPLAAFLLDRYFIKSRSGEISRKTISVMAGIIIIIFAVAESAGFFIQPDKIIAASQKNKLHSVIELSGNPVWNTLFPSASPVEPVQHKPSVAGNFSFGLNTDSLLQGSTVDGNNIRRGKKYNIILYFFESTPKSYLDLSINGKTVTPNWLKLREHSFIAERHYANYPLSASAMLSVLTSAYEHPSKDHVIQKYSHIPLRSMPEILKDNGYRTCVLHTGDLRYAGQRRFLSGRGIDRIIEMKDMEHTAPYNVKVGWGLDERAMTGPAVDFIKEKSKSPFFMAFFPANPHHPYAIPDDSFNITGPVPKGSDQKTRNWYNYLNSLHYADASLGILIDRLREEHLLDNTLIFVFADHGEAFYQHHMNYNHPFFLYEENVHVPFLIYSEQLFPEPVRFNYISRHIDILPTVLDLLSIPGDPRHEGKSLFSSNREQLALLHTSWKDDLMGIRDGRWKYIRCMTDGREELYDLDTDPLEKNNVVSSNEKIAENFREYIRSARKYNLQFYNTVLGKDGQLTEKPVAGTEGPS